MDVAAPKKRLAIFGAKTELEVMTWNWPITTQTIRIHDPIGHFQSNDAQSVSVFSMYIKRVFEGHYEFQIELRPLFRCACA